MKETVLTLCAALVLLLAAGCASSGNGKKGFLEKYDYNSDGKVTRDEYLRDFQTMDSNQDDVINEEEAGSVLMGH